MYCTYDITKFIVKHSQQQQNNNKLVNMIINIVKMVTTQVTKQCIKKNQPINQNIDRNIGTISKILIADIENFAILAAIYTTLNSTW